MKVSTILLGAAAVAPAAVAFPFMDEMMELAERADGQSAGTVLQNAINDRVKNMDGGILSMAKLGLEIFNAHAQATKQAQQAGVNLNPTVSMLQIPFGDYANWTEKEVYNALGFQTGNNVLNFTSNIEHVWSGHSATGFKSQKRGFLGDMFGQIKDGINNIFGGKTDSSGGILGGIFGGGSSSGGVVGFRQNFGQGQHAWVAPGPGDNRGPCPGLNTIANHGYIPHNGIVTPFQLMWGTLEGLSLSPDLAAILTFIGFLWKGDLTKMQLSIGQQPSGSLSLGLGNHGVIEGDASVTRYDKYREGNNGDDWSAIPERVEKLKEYINQYGNDIGNGQKDMSIATLSYARGWAWDDSNASNKNFDFNPWRALVAYGESGFVHQNLRGSSKYFTCDMVDYWFYKEQFPPGWTPRAIPMTTPEILLWAAIFEARLPRLPKYSLGYKSPADFLKALPTDPLGVLKTVICNVAMALQGLVPGTISALFGANELVCK